MLKISGQQLKFLLYAAENISMMAFGLIGAAMVARVFGPENMGRLSLVQAVSAIFMFLATLGLDHFVMREFANNKNDGEFKGTLILAQSLGWFLYAISLAIYFMVKGNISHEIYLITSVAVSTYFLRVLFLKLYLQAINDAKSVAISAVVSRVVALIYLFIGSLNHFSFDLMVLYIPLQTAIQALLMIKGYKKSLESPAKMTVSFKRMVNMVKESMPVLLATALYYGYSQADVLIVSYFMNMHDVGIYAAAMRLVPQAAFLGHITVITFYGTLSQHFNTDRAAFTLYATKIARIQFAIALPMAITFSILAPFLIWILYGSKFAESSAVLSIGVWAWLFMLPAALFSRLLVLCKLAKYELIKAFIVFPISLGFNFLLIPHYGAIAAAYVFVGTFILGDFLVYGLFKETRFIFSIGFNALTSLIKSPIASIKDSAMLFKHKP